MNAASEVLGLLEAVAGGPLPVRIRCWDGSEAGPPDRAATVVFHQPRALRRLLWAPNELGLVRGFVSGDADIEGDVFAVLDIKDVIDRVAAHQSLGLTGRERVASVRTAARLGALGPPPRPPAEELGRRRGAKHSTTRDAEVVSHHYDVGNDFYRLVLGPSMVYSCAYWTQAPSESYTLEHAQRDKLELICTKLSLRPGMRMLDVGCGWGSLLIHAAQHHGVTGVGVTVSHQQVERAQQRVAEAGLADRVEIRLQDYRDVQDGPYDAIASIGMAEHVGRQRLREYAATLSSLLALRGRLLNHAIASVRALPVRPKAKPSFIDRYIFPDGEILPVSATVDALEHAALEVRDGEALREHYGPTLRAWVNNLRGSWDEAQRLVSPARARTWLLYLAACALAFEHGGLTVHQLLAVKQDTAGASGLPRTRADWLTEAPH